MAFGAELGLTYEVLCKLQNCNADIKKFSSLFFSQSNLNKYNFLSKFCADFLFWIKPGLMDV